MDAKSLNIMKWVTGGLEALWGIPVLGGTLIIGMFWIPLAIMLVFHIVVVVIAYQNGIKAYGNVLGIVTSVVGVIPVVGMILHILSAVFIMVDAANQQKKLV